MAESFTYDVFLSHNSKDKPRVRKLAERLVKGGLRVWFDEWCIQPGGIIALKVDEGLEQSRVLLLCISSNALSSNWVALERSTAIHRDPANEGRRFIPLLLEDCELPDTLRRYKYVDFREEAEAAFAELLGSCRPEVLDTAPLQPVLRCWPFIRVDESFPLFHVPGASDPFPTRQEYLDGDVPTLAADVEVESRLKLHGWACCIDVASVGKTTLALRIATTCEQQMHPAFYLDLKKEILGDTNTSPVAAVRRLSQFGTLLILDNIHHQPELAHQLWQQWNALPTASRGRLFLVATQIHQPVIVTPEQDLTFFERHPTNPAILLRPGPEDLGRLAKHLYRRIGGAKCPAMPEPSAEVLAEWFHFYGAALNAFTFAVLESLADFEKGRWRLPPSRASAWVRKHWLDKLSAAELENAIYLAVFGAQDLEMVVNELALPHPEELEKLFTLGLVAQIRRGQFKQYRFLELREPGWGYLILAAQAQPIDNEQILFAAASRHLRTAIVLSARWQRNGSGIRLRRLWAHIAEKADGLVMQVWDLPLPYLPNLVRLAKFGGQSELVARFWNVLESEPDKLAAAMWTTPLEHLGPFLNMTRQHGRDAAKLWRELESRPDKLAAAMWATPLEHLGPFLNMAGQHGRDTAKLWQEIDGHPDKLAAALWTTSLGQVGSFFNVARQYGRGMARLWEEIESQPDKAVAAARATSLEQIGSFLNVARQHGRDTAWLWEEIEGQPDKFVAAVWATSLEHVGSFLNVAKQHGRDTAWLWEEIESQPDKLAAAAWATSLEHVGSFLNVAKQHGRDTDGFWKELESQSEKLAAAMWATPLGHVASFLNVARQHGRNVGWLCQSMENEPERLARKGRDATFGDLVGISHYAAPSLTKIVLQDVMPGHWSKTPDSEGMVGATWLAWECADVKRDDLAADLVLLLLRRANWRDFSPQSGGFAQVCWLLANVPSGATELVDSFIEAVCTETWLKIAYAAASCGQLASALRELALYQTPERCRQFHHKGLARRLNKELARFETVEPSEQTQIIQFLGSASFCGRAVSQRSLLDITTNSISALPLSVLPHRSDALKVENHQLQLWLGLRSFVSIIRVNVPLSVGVIQETLRLWQANLAETVSRPASSSHRLNQSMVAWLEVCLRANPPALVPSREPLWVLAGFPVRPQSR